jgi:hypothetical protein
VNSSCICSLSVTAVTIACNPTGTVHWTANVNNAGQCSTYDHWTAELQVKMSGNGQFQTVGSPMTGYTLFAPGNTVLNSAGIYDFCYVFAPGTNAIRVLVTLDNYGRNCKLQNKSVGIPPCNRTTACP